MEASNFIFPDALLQITKFSMETPSNSHVSQIAVDLIIKIVFAL